MRRREFIAGLGSVGGWPVVARAQQPAVPVIGYLGAQTTDEDYKNVTVPFLQGLKETGFVEGQNVTVEYRWAENQYDRLPALAADLARRRVAVIFASGTPAILAAKAVTTTIPIVFSTGGDPVALGLVASLNRPGANLTGSAVLTAELGPKRLQLLHELIPNAALFGRTRRLRVPSPPSPTCRRRHARWACNSLSSMPEPTATSKRPLQLFRNSALVRSWLAPASCTPGTRNNSRRWRPAMRCQRSSFREFVLAGGLMSYGSSLGYTMQRVGTYTGRILKGEKPADLPVQQITKIDLIINLKTAKTLGLTIPETLLATADEVIQ
jgi:putative ABC transport system substrate-binding protein